MITCPECKSEDCHEYSDMFVCFKCGYRLEIKPSKLPSSVWDKVELTKLGHTTI
jgi:transcription initiation factor TFIIIB Brf1 subunit/transcription initiation factor TFIIB